MNRIGARRPQETAPTQSDAVVLEEATPISEAAARRSPLWRPTSTLSRRSMRFPLVCSRNNATLVTCSATSRDIKGSRFLSWKSSLRHHPCGGSKRDTTEQLGRDGVDVRQ
ncbi:hypothetical protein MRX96_037808 [Rhipicephalus microplus]